MGERSNRALAGNARQYLSAAMFAGIIEWSMANGYHEIVTATDLRFERILKRAGWPMQRLGPPCPIGNSLAVAGILSADVGSLDRICAGAARPGTRHTVAV
nr:acyl-homoserine-lactone synthase [Sinorhizobium meliloti]